MKYILILEEVALFVLTIFLFPFFTNLPWYFYAGFFFTPDISFLGYAASPKIGSIFYNIFHHKGIWLLCGLIGYFTNLEWLLGIGVVYFGHSAFDRIFGYGLKHFDSFQNTHLGKIGNQISH
ncbi:MAG: DUF4260 domain-containing protein [Balneola sp.]